MPTIEIPAFWTFRYPCSCPYGSLVADQSPEAVIATEEQAWADFYYGRKREQNKARRQGCYVTPEKEFNKERWMAGHSHPDCTRPPEPEPDGNTLI